MVSDEIKKVLDQEKDIAVRINSLVEKYQKAGLKEKLDLKANISALIQQLKVLNLSIPALMNKLASFKTLPQETAKKPAEKKIGQFTQERLLLKQRKRNLTSEKKMVETKASFYVKISNRFFSNFYR